MLRICLPALAGAASLSLLPQLPPTAGAWVAAAIGLGLTTTRRTQPLAAWLLGLLLMWSAANQQLADQLPSAQDGNTFKFIAEVIEFPREEWPQVRLLVAPVEAPGLPERLRLTYFEPDRVPQVGEFWALTARLRSPRGNRNPGGFDYAGWLHRQGVGASGYVLTAELLTLGSLSFVQRLRAHAVQRLSRLLPEDDASATLLAISVGARHQVSRAAWDRYAATGTSHLMAISGLHIGLAAAGAGLLAWLSMAFCQPRGNSRDTATAIALLAAVVYAAISGFAVPAQRACLMLGLLAVGVLRRQVLSPQEVLAAAALLLFMVEPLVILSPGYWLSFMAVAVLLWLARERQAAVAPGAFAHARRWLMSLLQLQAMLLLGLFPLTTLLFERLAWLAPAANLLVLPVFSIVTVPLALLGLLLDGPLAVAGDLMLRLAYHSLQLINHLLTWLAGWPGAGYRLATPTGFASIMLWLPLLWVLLPRGAPGRGLAWVALVFVVVSRPPPPPPGCFDLYTLDVGQGLANVVRTPTRTLLFDTGPAFRGGSNSAEHVVLPFLRSQGIRQLDMLVISHADQDHASGMASVLAALPVATSMTGEPPGVTASSGRQCAAGQHWRWDGIDFAILHPERGGVGTDGNNASCVLLIAAGKHRVLLTGDIERPVETRLSYGGRLRPVAVALVPHHGSRTSSSSSFIAALQAEVAVVSAGYRNRWGFPKDDVVTRWQQSGAKVLTTAASGAIQHRLCREQGLVLELEYRKSAARYWHDRG